MWGVDLTDIKTVNKELSIAGQVTSDELKQLPEALFF